MNHSVLTLATLFSLLTFPPRAPAVQDGKPFASQGEATSVDSMAREATRIADQ
jgi:hypothetical protein